MDTSEYAYIYNNSMITSEELASLARDLSSLDHAILLSLIAKQHCLIETTAEALDDVAREIRLIATQLFGLSSAILQCHADTTLEDFSRGILVDRRPGDSPPSGSGSGFEASPPFRRASSYSVTKPQSSTDWSIASIVIAKDLNACSQQVQIQALELIRTHRIFTHTSVYATPKPFLFVALSSTGAESLNTHLNDTIFLSHFHDPIDELPRLSSQRETRSTASSPSVNSSSIRYSFPAQDRPLKSVPFPAAVVLQLSSLPASVTITSEVRSYLMSLAIFIRTHRALIPGSATPLATQYLDLLSRCLALLHGLDFVSPALVALAARKIYRHRLQVLKPEDAAWERSVMYGSRVKDVQELLEGMWLDAEGKGEVADRILDDVISRVEVPV